MKKITLLILMLISFNTVFAQHPVMDLFFYENRFIRLPRPQVFKMEFSKEIYKSYTPALQVNHSTLLQQLNNLEPADYSLYKERPMDMQVLSEAYMPYFNVFAPMLQRVSPMALDFDESSLLELNPHMGLLTRGQQYTWPGMGGLNRISSTYLYQYDNWLIGGGAFAGTYFTPFNPSPKYMGGFHVTAAYEVNDLLTLRGWGSYTFYDKKERNNPHMLMNPFYNHTNVGGAFEFKVKDDFKMGFGLNYEYNPVRGKMDRQILISPAGKIGNIRISN